MNVGQRIAKLQKIKGVINCTVLNKFQHELYDSCRFSSIVLLFNLFPMNFQLFFFIEMKIPF